MQPTRSPEPTLGAVVFQSSGLDGDDLVKALEGLGLEEGGSEGGGGGGGGGDDDGNILPIMQSIMQNLLSKEVLYPSLKEITAKVCVGSDRFITLILFYYTYFILSHIYWFTLILLHTYFILSRLFFIALILFYHTFI